MNETTMDLSGAISVLTEVRKRNFYNWDLTAKAAVQVLDRLELLESMAADDHYLQAELLIEESRDVEVTDGEGHRLATLLEALVHAILALRPERAS